MQTQFRDLIQITSGDLKGLICTVLAVNNGKIECFCRDHSGEPHFFSLSAADGVFSKVGVAVLGPKPTNTESPSVVATAASPAEQSPSAALPEPLKPSDYLAPIPADAKIVPMEQVQSPDPWAIEEPSVAASEQSDLGAGAATTPQGLQGPLDSQKAPRQPTLPPFFHKKKTKGKHTKSPRLPVPKRPFTAVVKNGSGDEATVTVMVYEGIEDPSKRYGGIAVIAAQRVIPNVKPFSVTGWKPKV